LARDPDLAHQIDNVSRNLLLFFRDIRLRSYFLLPYYFEVFLALCLSIVGAVETYTVLYLVLGATLVFGSSLW
jgi:hypothetical protein